MGLYAWNCGVVYEGGFDRGMPNGQGRFSYPDGGSLQGTVRQGYCWGRAVQSKASGEVYTGEFEQDLRKGQGSVVFGDKELGLFFEGGFFNDRFEEEGKLFKKGDLIYSGGFMAGVYHGVGKKYYQNGDTYEGDFSLGLKHGEGLYTFKNGDTYTGGYKDGKRAGKGKFQFVNGISYEGGFENGVKNGYGELTIKDKFIFKGKFKNDKMGGEGELKYTHPIHPPLDTSSEISVREKFLLAPSNEYKTNSFKGTLTGTYKSPNSSSRGSAKTSTPGYHRVKGILTYSDGSVYEGSFYMGLRHGYGKYTGAYSEPYPSYGVDYEGEWENDLPHGKGSKTIKKITRPILKTKSNSKPDSKPVVSKPSPRSEVSSKQTVIESVFSEGLLSPSSPPLIICPDGSTFRGFSLPSQILDLLGPSKTAMGLESNQSQTKGVFTDINKVQYQGLWDANGMQGEGEEIYPDGSKFVGEYKNGKRKGKGTMYHANGKKTTKKY